MLQRVLVLVLVVGAGAGCGASAPPPAPVANRAPPPAAEPAKQPVPVADPDPHTILNLYVTPADGTTWKLDGELHTERLPTRIGGLAPGIHSVELVPPPGYRGRTLTIELGAGESQTVTVVLEPAP